jgi:uncharacterized protein YidB (DUF937 family)
MGLLDGLLGGALGGLLGGGNSATPAQAQGPLLQMALQLLQQNGGISGVIGKLRQAGYGAQADSWVGTGENQPISPDALQQVLGHGQLGDLASKLGLAQGAAAGGLAAMLPQIIDRFTPQGQIPDNHGDLVAQALSMLQKSRSA